MRNTCSTISQLTSKLAGSAIRAVPGPAARRDGRCRDRLARAAAAARLASGPLGPRPGEERRIARLLLALSPGDDVLDVGCGEGELLEVFAHAVRPRGRVVGVDASATALATAAAAGRAGEDVALLRCDAEVLPFRAAAFDAVCCAGVLEEAGAPWRLLDEIVRVLRPGDARGFMAPARASPSPAPATRPAARGRPGPVRRGAAQPRGRRPARLSLKLRRPGPRRRVRHCCAE